MKTGDELPRISTGDGITDGGDRIRLYTFAAMTSVFIGLSVLLAFPFISAIAWGVALAIIARPLHSWIEARLHSPGIAAALSAVLVASVILAAGVFLTYQLGREATYAAERIQGETVHGGIRQKLDEYPVLAPVTVWMDRVGLDVENETRKLVDKYTQDFSTLASGSLASTAQFLAAVFILFYVLRDRHHFVKGLRGLLPLTSAEADHVIANAADSVHANLYATLVTSIIDSVCMGLLFWLIGLPAALLWAVVMFVLCFLPIVGAAFVWIPAAAYLIFSGNVGGGVAVVALGTLLFVVVDNFTYARLAGNRMRMHEVPALLSFFGGLALFGMAGMVLGPAILAVTYAFIEVWKHRMGNRRTEHGKLVVSDTIS